MSSRSSAPPAPMDAKLMVATESAECQQLKELVNREDADRMVVVMASSNKKTSAAAEIPVAATMHPLLLESACCGYWKGLNFLLNREDAQADSTVMPDEAFLQQIAAYNTSNCTNGSSPMQRASEDVEVGPDMLSLSAESLVMGVTAQGDTALHVVASHGDEPDFLQCANTIYAKAKHLLFQPNSKGDTPLHSAAKAGKSKMVSHLIGLATDDLERSPHNGVDDKNVKDLLRAENGSKETALHGAVRIGDIGIVKSLMAADPLLARFPEEGSSPLYLAILLNNYDIARKLYKRSEGNILSYAGPNGQNALHAAVLRSEAMTGQLLKWNISLTTQRDENGSTPLHFASSISASGETYITKEIRWVNPHSSFRWPRVLYSRHKMVRKVFNANGSPLYQPDNCGLFPIHVAASLGEKMTIQTFVKKYPSSAGLLDKRGRTFLHVAVENKKDNIVGYACKDRSLTWILNMQDNDGNTALHLAVEAGHIQMFSYLCRNLHVLLNLPNKKGQTPRDIAHNKIPPGLYYLQSSEFKIRSALVVAGAACGSVRGDHLKEKYEEIHQLKADGERKELEKVKDATQTLAIGSVLIATVTFGASFALPGGFKADDHTNGGTPTLAGRYAFDAFIIANTFAFAFSSIATIGLMYSGSPLYNLRSRRTFLRAALYSMETSITCLIAAFTLGVYTFLAPVAPSTAIAVCIISSLVVLFKKLQYWLSWGATAPSFTARTGPVFTCGLFLMLIGFTTLTEYLPLIVIFIWPIHGRNHPAVKMEPPAPFA